MMTDRSGLATAMSFLFHPAFQSAVLPLLLAMAGVALLRPAGHRWAAWGAVLGLLGSLAVLPGYAWPAESATQRLPWIVLGAALVGACATGLSRTRPPDPLAGADLAAAWVVALLGLTALAALGGSLLLAQLALMVAVTTAVPGLWAWGWPSAGVRVGLPVVLPVAVAALLIAWALPGSGLAGGGRLALLALALCAPMVVARLRGSGGPGRLVPLAVAALAAVPVALAVAWLLVSGEAPTAAGSDDPYYQPGWNQPRPGGD